MKELYKVGLEQYDLIKIVNYDPEETELENVKDYLDEEGIILNINNPEDEFCVEVIFLNKSVRHKAIREGILWRLEDIEAV